MKKFYRVIKWKDNKVPRFSAVRWGKSDDLVTDDYAVVANEQKFNTFIEAKQIADWYNKITEPF